MMRLRSDGSVYVAMRRTSRCAPSRQMEQRSSPKACPSLRAMTCRISLTYGEADASVRMSMTATRCPRSRSSCAIRSRSRAASSGAPRLSSVEDAAAIVVIIALPGIRVRKGSRGFPCTASNLRRSPGGNVTECSARDALADEALDLAHHGFWLARLGEITVTPRLHGALAIGRQGMRGERDDRDAPRLRIMLEHLRGLPAINHRNGDVHEDKIRPGCPCLRDAILTIERFHYVVAEVLKNCGINDAVVFVVFHEQHGLAD